jgi:hypothetical protein
MTTTLLPLLRGDAVATETLHARYGALLELVRSLIGVVPNCDAYLEIWPPGFRTYNVMVPNLLNLPLSVWGFATPPSIVGLGMYVSSRAAECAYCSAHTCSFALRRGTSQERLARAMADEDVDRTPAERAVMAIARSLSRVPSTATDAERAALREHFGKGDVEWIVLGVAMMGWLNKFMDAIGVELEPEAIRDAAGVIGPSGWSPGKHATGAVIAASTPPKKDTLGTKLGLIPRIPSALSLDRRWTKGVPSGGPAVRRFLAAAVGHDFPVLERLSHGRARRAMATMVRDNLDPDTTRTGLEAKVLAGIVYATIVGDAVERDMGCLAKHHAILADRRDAAARFALGEGLDGVDAPTAAILRLARAASPSPAAIDSSVVEGCRALEPAAIIETIVWLSVLQMLHRVSAFYAA